MVYDGQKFKFMIFLQINHLVTQLWYFKIQFSSTKWHKYIKRTLLIRRKKSKFSCWAKKLEKNHPLRSNKSKEKVDCFCSMLTGFVSSPYSVLGRKLITRRFHLPFCLVFNFLMGIFTWFHYEQNALSFNGCMHCFIICISFIIRHSKNKKNSYNSLLKINEPRCQIPFFAKSTGSPTYIDQLLSLITNINFIWIKYIY